MDSQLQKLRKALESAVDGMSGEQMERHPSGKWCTAQILEHLYLTYTGTIKGFERVLEAGKPLATSPSITHRMKKFVVIRLGYLPSGRKSPSVAEPRGLPAHKVRKEITAKIGELDAILAQCDARFGRSLCLLDHPILGPLTASQWRKFHMVHGLHHVKQIIRLREAAKLTS